MAALLHANSRHLGAATVCGRLYAVDWYPGMVPSHAQEECVTGDVFALDPESADRIFRELDQYEGDGFERRPVEVTLPDGTRVSAFAYLYASGVDGLPRIASGEWTRRSIAGPSIDPSVA